MTGNQAWHKLFDVAQTGTAIVYMGMIKYAVIIIKTASPVGKRESARGIDGDIEHANIVYPPFVVDRNGLCRDDNLAIRDVQLLDIGMLDKRVEFNTKSRGRGCLKRALQSCHCRHFFLQCSQVGDEIALGSFDHVLQSYNFGPQRIDRPFAYTTITAEIDVFCAQLGIVIARTFIFCIPFACKNPLERFQDTRSVLSCISEKNASGIRFFFLDQLWVHRRDAARPLKIGR